MSKLEDLHTLVRLLNEFELPVSPILEYAIKNKKEELQGQGSGQMVVSPTTEDIQYETVTSSSDKEESRMITRKKAKILEIRRSDGTIIREKKAAYTMCKAIKEIGVEAVYEIKIPMDGMYLVTQGGNPLYPSEQHDVDNGFFVNVHSNTATKKRQLDKIFKALNLKWEVEIVELN